MLNQWLILIPEITFTFLILNLLIFALIYGNNFYNIKIYAGLSIQILLIILLLLNNSIYEIYIGFNPFIMDNITYLFNNLIIVFSIILIYMIIPLIKMDIRYTFEFFILILISVLSMLLLIKSNDLISMYLTIELQSMAFYILAAFGKTSKYGTEAGLKYYVMGALASNFQLLGLAFIYVIFGFTNYMDIEYYLLLNENNEIINIIFILILIGLIFKIGGVPFHQWLPDVYQGSPLASTIFFSIIPKFPIFIAIYRILLFLPDSSFFYFIISLSFIIPAILALKQYNLKRLFAYSSINHVAFILISALTSYWTASFFYIFVYILMNLGIFAILIQSKISTYVESYYSLLQYANLNYKLPVISFTFSIILFSMAGIPPLAGFFSKYYILENALYNNYIVLSFIAILSSILAAFYYLQIIQYLYFYKFKFNFNLNMILTNFNQSAIIISSITSILFIFFFQQNFIFLIFNQYF